MNRIVIDLFHPIRPLRDGYRYVIMAVDAVTRYVWLKPLRSTTARESADAFFDSVVANDGCAELVTSDHGSNFASDFWQRVLERLGTATSFSCASHPQSQGKAEHFSKTLKSAIGMYAEKYGKDWPDYLSALSFAYNGSFYSTSEIRPPS